MKAIENLRDYIDNFDHYQPAPASIDALGTDLVRAASVPEGYTDLVWEAGEWLLMHFEDLKHSSTEFFQAFGYRAIANALRSSLETGDFPLALGFLVHDFVPEGGLKTLAANALIQQALKNIPEKKLVFSVTSLQEVDSKCRKKYLEFLRYASDFGFPPLSILQMAAALLTVASEDEKPAVTQLFLDMLEANGKTISLFFCWRAASETILLAESEKTYAGSLMNVLKACQQLEENALPAVANLLDDQKLPSLIGDDPCLLILLGLVGWWISVRYERSQYTNIARTFCYSLTRIAPDLAHTLLAQIDRVSDSQLDDTDADTEAEDQQRAILIEQLQIDFQQEMQVLRGELRIRSYQGVPLALKMYRHNVVHIFDPLYTALEDSSALTEEQIAQIENLEAVDLIDNNPLHLENVHTRREIIGALRAHMIRDQQTIIQSFQRALALRKQLTQSTEYDPIVALANASIKREVKQLLQMYPDLLWAFQWLLPEVLETH